MFQRTSNPSQAASCEVTTSIDGIPEQLDGATGFLTPPGNAYAIAARIRMKTKNQFSGW